MIGTSLMPGPLLPGPLGASSGAPWRELPEPVLITQRKAADIVCCDERTIRRRIADGTLSRYANGRVDRNEVEAKGEALKQRQRAKKAGHNANTRRRITKKPDTTGTR